LMFFLAERFFFLAFQRRVNMGMERFTHLGRAGFVLSNKCSDCGIIGVNAGRCLCVGSCFICIVGLWQR